MEVNKWAGKASGFLKKFRYPIILLAVGILLMALPGKNLTKKTEEVPKEQQHKESLDRSMENILAQIKGVGKVQVLLTQASGESYRYQFDEDISLSENGSSTRKDTVIITDGDRNQQALITQVLPPTYLGAIIVCQGAEDPAVKLAVVEAVSRLTGLGADKISVLKMK